MENFKPIQKCQTYKRKEQYNEPLYTHHPTSTIINIRYFYFMYPAIYAYFKM